MSINETSQVIKLLSKRHIIKEKNATNSDDATIESLLKLTHLRLDRENLTKIPQLDFLPLVTNLYLQANNIGKIENLSNLQSLKFMTLSNNRISSVEGLKNLKSLGFLDLSCNFIHDVDVTEFPEYLVILNMKDNPCTQVAGYQESIINQLKNLKSLDLIPVEIHSCNSDSSGSESESEVEQSDTKERVFGQVDAPFVRMTNEKEALEKISMQQLRNEIDQVMQELSSTLSYSLTNTNLELSKLSLGNELDSDGISSELDDNYKEIIREDLLSRPISKSGKRQAQKTENLNHRDSASSNSNRRIRIPGARPIRRVFK